MIELLTVFTIPDAIERYIYNRLFLICNSLNLKFNNNYEPVQVH